MKNKTTQGLGNKKLLSFPKHDSLNQSHYFDHSPICQESSGVSKETTCADNMKLYTAENFTSRYETHVTEVLKDMFNN